MTSNTAPFMQLADPPKARQAAWTCSLVQRFASHVVLILVVAHNAYLSREMNRTKVLCQQASQTHDLQQQIAALKFSLAEKVNKTSIMQVQLNLADKVDNGDLLEKANNTDMSAKSDEEWILKYQHDRKMDLIPICCTALQMQLSSKADRKELDDKASKAFVGQKADQAYVVALEAKLQQKADRKDLDDRASKAYVDQKLQQKADRKDLDDKTSKVFVDQKAHQSYIVALDAKLQQKADKSEVPSFADMPLTPNLLQDTKHFKSLCNGVVGQARPWNSGWGGPWGWFEYGSGNKKHLPEGTLTDLDASTLQVVDLTSRDKAEAAGLWPFGDLESLLTMQETPSGSFYGADIHALILAIHIKDTANSYSDGRAYALNQGCQKYTSWNIGQFMTQTGSFVNVLEHTGKIQLKLWGNRGAAIRVAGPSGKGWKYDHSTKRGLGGCEQSYFTGAGFMRVAIALPYESFGNHGEVPVWMGYDSTFFLGNV